jgi:hypothetical protein
MIKAKQELKEDELRQTPKHLIGTLGERNLHSSLKDWYAQPGDSMEAQVDGFHMERKGDTQIMFSSDTI